MRKVIVCIALIVCLDAAFILITRLTNERSESATIFEPVRVQPDKTVSASVKTEGDVESGEIAALNSDILDDARDPFARDAEPNQDTDLEINNADTVVTNERYAPSRPARQPVFRQKHNAGPIEFRTVTITYDDSKRLTAKDLGKQTKTERSTAAATTPEKKRSTLVKIVRSPYDLLRSAVSSLR